MNNFKRELEEAKTETPDKKFSKQMNRAADELNKPKYALKFRTLETGTTGNKHIKISAYIGTTEVGSLWVRDHGGTIGKDFSDAKGIFKIDAYYDAARKVIEK